MTKDSTASAPTHFIVTQERRNAGVVNEVVSSDVVTYRDLDAKLDECGVPRNVRIGSGTYEVGQQFIVRWGPRPDQCGKPDPHGEYGTCVLHPNHKDLHQDAHGNWFVELNAVQHAQMTLDHIRETLNEFDTLEPDTLGRALATLLGVKRTLTDAFDRFVTDPGGTDGE